jgi:hypothetical protein
MTTADTEGSTAVAEGEVCSPRLLPSATRSEKGTRNFTDAIHQIQYRVRAWFFLKARTISPAPTAKAVDCQV